MHEDIISIHSRNTSIHITVNSPEIVVNDDFIFGRFNDSNVFCLS